MSFTNSYRLGETCRVDLYTSINSCRNLRTTVKRVFHEKKNKKNTKREWKNNSERHFFCSILTVEIQSYCTQKDKNLIKKYQTSVDYFIVEE